MASSEIEYKRTQNRELAHQTAIVTGASSGIGRATAIALARAGADVVVHYRTSQAAADEVVMACQKWGVRSIAIHADLTQATQVESLIEQGERFGAVRILVNNAGSTLSKLLLDTTLADWHAVMDANATSTFLTTQLVLPTLLQAGYGRIIQVSSVWGVVGGACEAAYSAAKGAVIAFTKALAKEVARSNITVNAVAPGAIETRMLKELSEEERAMLADEIPVGRLGHPNEVAELIRFLATPQASYITGQVISQNGGWFT